MLPLKKIYRKDFYIDTSFWLSDHNADLGKKIRETNVKLDGSTKG